MVYEPGEQLGHTQVLPVTSMTSKSWWIADSDSGSCDGCTRFLSQVSRPSRPEAEFATLCPGLSRDRRYARKTILGNHLGVLNQRLVAHFAVPFSVFAGDIFVYQAHKDEIQDRIWEALAKEAPGVRDFGTTDPCDST